MKKNPHINWMQTMAPMLSRNTPTHAKIRHWPTKG